MEACHDDEVVDSSLTQDPFGDVMDAGGEVHEKVEVEVVLVGDEGLAIPEQP